MLGPAMGGAAWAKTKARARKAVRKVAFDLVKLYAERTESPGYAFPPDGPWQNELEDSFPYEPTPDQLKAITDVKRDMEVGKPMDRLVCGDVGFGKWASEIKPGVYNLNYLCNHAFQLAIWPLKQHGG